MTEINIKSKTTLRHDTVENWVRSNPILLNGEVGVETDTSKMKMGDGKTQWNDLGYMYSSLLNDEIDTLFN